MRLITQRVILRLVVETEHAADETYPAIKSPANSKQQFTIISTHTTEVEYEHFRKLRKNQAGNPG